MDARGSYNLNLSEATDWGTGAESRKKCLACAMVGAYVMILGMDIASTDKSDLEDCGRLVSFFESTDFQQMSPHDELALATAQYVLARPGGSYIAYASQLQGEIGLKNMQAGVYKFHWIDCAAGSEVTKENVAVPTGDRSWGKPDRFGSELAVYIERTGGL